LAREAAMIPFPNEEVTPPVTKTYLAIQNGYLFFTRSGILKQVKNDDGKSSDEKPTQY
jgi:hypothetical protein